MNGVAKACVGLAVLGFILAVIITLFTGPVMGITAESASRASQNLSLIALCLFVGFKEEADGGA